MRSNLLFLASLAIASAAVVPERRSECTDACFEAIDTCEIALEDQALLKVAVCKSVLPTVCAIICVPVSLLEGLGIVPPQGSPDPDEEEGDDNDDGNDDGNDDDDDDDEDDEDDEDEDDDDEDDDDDDEDNGEDCMAYECRNDCAITFDDCYYNAKDDRDARQACSTQRDSCRNPCGQVPDEADTSMCKEYPCGQQCAIDFDSCYDSAFLGTKTLSECTDEVATCYAKCN